MGPSGAAGAAGVTGPARPGGSAIYLASCRPITGDEWLGLGASSDLYNFAGNTVTIPVNAIITGIVFNIRHNVLLSGQSVTATVYTSPCGFTAAEKTTISATVAGPNSPEDPNCCAVGCGSVRVNQGDLLSVLISPSHGVSELCGGVAATVYLAIP